MDNVQWIMYIGLGVINKGPFRNERAVYKWRHLEEGVGGFIKRWFLVTVSTKLVSVGLKWCQMVRNGPKLRDGKDACSACAACAYFSQLCIFFSRCFTRFLSFCAFFLAFLCIFARFWSFFAHILCANFFRFEVLRVLFCKLFPSLPKWSQIVSNGPKKSQKASHSSNSYKWPKWASRYALRSCFRRDMLRKYWGNVCETLTLQLQFPTYKCTQLAQQLWVFLSKKILRGLRWKLCVKLNMAMVFTVKHGHMKPNLSFWPT